jgi:hypothetical protein
MVPDLTLYVSVLAAMLALGVAVRYLIVVPRRRCLQCDRSISVVASRCRGCGYRYAAGGLLDPSELDR